MPPLSSWKMPFVSPRQSSGERRLVVERERVGIDPLAAGFLDQLDAAGEDRQVAQAEEVHLQQAGRFDVAHRPLGDDVGLALHVLQRHVLVDRLVGDHDRRGVGADVAGEAFDLLRQVDQLANFVIACRRSSSARRWFRAPS